MTDQDATHAIATKPDEQSWRNWIAANDAEAPMTTNAPEPIPQPGYGHPLMMPIWFFAIIGAAVTGVWLAKGAAAVARAAGWL